MRWVKRILAVLLLLAAVAGVVYAMRPRPIDVETTTATRGRLESTVDEEGRTRVRDRYVISTPFAGNMRRLELHPGDLVETTTVLARVVPSAPALLDARSRSEAEGRVRSAEASLRQTQATVAGARNALEFARAETDRLRPLAATGSIAPRELELAEFQARTRSHELDSAQFAARVAAYELENARVVLRRSETPVAENVRQEEIEIRSPIRGRVLRVLRESAGVVAPGTQLLEIGDTEALELVVDVLTQDAVQIRPGARAVIERWGGEQPLSAHVRLIEPSAFSRVSPLGVEEQRVNVILDLADPPDRWRALGDGYRIEARMVVWEGDDVVRAPLGAVFRVGNRWATYVVDGDRARRRFVEIGRRGGLDVHITAGLRAGERVVLHPGDRVVDGVLVHAGNGT